MAPRSPHKPARIAILKRPNAPKYRLLRVLPAVADRLGDNPGATIAELLALREAVGQLAPADLRANPFLAVKLDGETPRNFFRSSTIAGLRSYRGTEHDLVTAAASASERSPESMARTGLVSEAMRELASKHRRDAAAAKNRAPNRGTIGAHDAEYRTAAERIVSERGYVTATNLRTATGHKYTSCVRFLDRVGGTMGLKLDGSGGNRWIPMGPLGSRASGPVEDPNQ